MTYHDVIAEIARLEKEAKKLRGEELSSVIKIIKRQIADYGITPADLGFGATNSGKIKDRASITKKSTSKLGKRPSGSRRVVSPKYRDDAGNTWTGRGKKPRWLVAALSAGRTLESLLIS